MDTSRFKQSDVLNLLFDIPPELLVKTVVTQLVTISYSKRSENLNFATDKLKNGSGGNKLNPTTPNSYTLKLI